MLHMCCQPFALSLSGQLSCNFGVTCFFEHSDCPVATLCGCRSVDKHEGCWKTGNDNVFQNRFFEWSSLWHVSLTYSDSLVCMLSRSLLHCSWRIFWHFIRCFWHSIWHIFWLLTVIFCDIFVMIMFGCNCTNTSLFWPHFHVHVHPGQVDLLFSLDQCVSGTQFVSVEQHPWYVNVAVYAVVLEMHSYIVFCLEHLSLALATRYQQCRYLATKYYICCEKPMTFKMLFPHWLRATHWKYEKTQLQRLPTQKCHWFFLRSTWWMKPNVVTLSGLRFCFGAWKICEDVCSGAKTIHDQFCFAQEPWTESYRGLHLLTWHFKKVSSSSAKADAVVCTSVTSSLFPMSACLPP